MRTIRRFGEERGIERDYENIASFRETLLRYRVIFPGVYRNSRNREVTLKRQGELFETRNIYARISLGRDALSLASLIDRYLLVNGTEI